jgi:hypothetical protein
LSKSCGDPKIIAKDVDAACALLSGADLALEGAARHMGISPATLYRQFPAACPASRDEA